MGLAFRRGRIPEEIAHDPLSPIDLLPREPAGLPEPREIPKRIRDPHRRYARLPASQKVARPPRLEVFLGDREAVRRLLEDAEPLARLFPRVPADDERAERAAGRPSDAPAELVQLREAEALRVLDDHERRLRHIDADLDDRRRDQDADPSRREIVEDPC